MSDSILDGYKQQAQKLMDIMPGFAAVRDRAVAALDDMVLPSSKSEEFRYASLKRFKQFLFSPAETGLSVDAGDALVDEVSARIVYVNGRYDENHSDYSELAQTAMVRALGNYFTSMENRATDMHPGSDILALLNTALTREGMAIALPAGVELEDPVEFHHIMKNAGGQATHPRHVIELGEKASMVLIERYDGDDSDYWFNETLQIRVSEGAKLLHIRLVSEGDKALHSSRAHVTLDAEAQYQAFTMSAGGEESRFDVTVRVLGHGAEAHVDGVLLAKSGQRAELGSDMHHVVESTDSDQVIRAIASGSGKTAFRGKITVHEGAQFTNADQSTKSLLLDRTAEANAKPELEIFADDVKCSHGATVGELDKDSYFYLISRGVEPNIARRILVEAFAADALNKLPDGEMKDKIMDQIGVWMADAYQPKSDDAP